MSLTIKARALIITFMMITAVAIAVAIGLYFYKFGPGSGFALSRTTTDWATFGDYLAGTLGPFFSLLAFAGVLCTVWLQASQIEITLAQSSIEEIQRALSNIAIRIDEILAQSVNQNFTNARLREFPRFIF